MSWSSAQAGYSSSFSVLLQSDPGLALGSPRAGTGPPLSRPGSWYRGVVPPHQPHWTRLGVPGHRSAADRGGDRGAPLLAGGRGPRCPALALAVRLKWSRGTFALLVIALALATGARTPAAARWPIAALAYTAAVLAADWPELRSAPQRSSPAAAIPCGRWWRPARRPALGVALLPGLVLLVAAARCFARLPRPVVSSRPADCRPGRYWFVAVGLGTLLAGRRAAPMSLPPGPGPTCAEPTWPRNEGVDDSGRDQGA